MKYLKYELYQSTIEESGEVITITKALEWSEENAKLAALEAYNGIIEEIEVDEEPAPATNEQRLTELEEAVNLLLEGATE